MVARAEPLRLVSDENDSGARGAQQRDDAMMHEVSTDLYTSGRKRVWAQKRGADAGRLVRKM